MPTDDPVVDAAAHEDALADFDNAMEKSIRTWEYLLMDACRQFTSFVKSDMEVAGYDNVEIHGVDRLVNAIRDIGVE